MDSSNCINSAYPYPGLIKFQYKGLYTLPVASHLWRFVFNGNLVNINADRGAAITNLAAPGSTVVELIDTLDNTWHDNTSADFANEPKIIYCVGVADSFNPGAYDADGDSLVFSLVSALDGPAACISASSPAVPSYIVPNSATSPLLSTSFTANSSTGTLAWYLNVIQLSVVVYNVREYRNDTFIGSTMREFQVLANTVCSPVCFDTISLSTANFQSSTGLICYPNPTSGILNLEVPEVGGACTITVADIWGRVVKTQTSENKANGKITADLNELKPGIYFLQLIFPRHIYPFQEVKIE